MNCGVIFHLCTRTVIDLVVSSSWLSFLSNFLYVRTKNSCPFSSSKKPKRRKSGGTHRFSVEQDLWLWATVGRTVTKKNGWRNSRTLVPTTSRTKLFQNGRDSETSTTRVKRRCSCRQCRPRDFLFFMLFGFTRNGFKKCLENEGAET